MLLRNDLRVLQRVAQGTGVFSVRTSSHTTVCRVNLFLHGLQF